MFDWDQFLQDYGIEHQYGGKNTKAGNIGLNCPLCRDSGDPDPSTHMGINPKTGYYNCWRNADHAGKSPPRIIKHLVGCSYKTAKEIEEEYSEQGTVRGTKEGLKEKILPKHRKKAGKHVGSLSVPEGVIDLVNTPITKRPTAALVSYMVNARGFHTEAGLGYFRPPLTEKGALNYPVWGGYYGYWKNRILFPVIEEGNVITWTSRSLTNKGPRHKSLPTKEEDAKKIGCDPAIISIKNCLYLPTNVPLTGTLLLVCEGAIDALKLYAGFRYLCMTQPKYNRYVVMPVCIFGLNISRRQKQILKRLSFFFDESYLVLDEKAETEAMKMSLFMEGQLPVCSKSFPGEDPGALSIEQSADFIKRMLDDA